MQEIKKAITLDSRGYYTTHLSILNCILPQAARMTPMEIKVLAEFMSIEGDLAIYRFGPSAKKVVMKELNLSPSGLSNYLRTLTEKELLYETGDITNIQAILIPEPEEQFYRFRLIRKDVKTISNAQATTSISETN